MSNLAGSGDTDIDSIVLKYAKKPLLPDQHRGALIEACISGNSAVFEKYV